MVVWNLHDMRTVLTERTNTPGKGNIINLSCKVPSLVPLIYVYLNYMKVPLF